MGFEQNEKTIMRTWEDNIGRVCTKARNDERFRNRHVAERK